MKRNEDLIREILLSVENFPFDTDAEWASIWGSIKLKKEFSKCTNKEISYHVLLLYEAGFLKAFEIKENVWLPVRLTWDGHEFLDSARDDKRWRTAKKSMASIGGFSFEIAKQLLVELVKNQLNLP